MTHIGFVRKDDKTLTETSMKQFKSIFRYNFNRNFYSIPKSVKGGGYSEIKLIFFLVSLNKKLDGHPNLSDYHTFVLFID